MAVASGFNVICGTFRMHGILFASLRVVGFVMVLVGLVMLVLFASWRYNKLEEGVKRLLVAMQGYVMLACVAPLHYGFYFFFFFPDFAIL